MYAVSQNNHTVAPKSQKEAPLLSGDAVAAAVRGTTEGTPVRLSLYGFPSVLVSQRLQACSKTRAWRRDPMYAKILKIILGTKAGK